MDGVHSDKGPSMSETRHCRLLILGSGPAGYTAAVYAARANLNPVLITGMEMGGQMTTTTDVENFPGFPDGVMGPELMQNFRNQALRFGAEIDTVKWPEEEEEVPEEALAVLFGFFTFFLKFKL